MELYATTAYALSRELTLHYSTSFGMSSRLFDSDIQPHIYAIYGLVRIADEIVDTYHGDDAAALLDGLEGETERAMKTGFSTNPIVHAFALTARRFDITPKLTRPFFASMRLDLAPHTYTPELYHDYIHGSAEVIGLMCLRVFTGGDTTHYESLALGAKALGAAYQKINFLRDLHDDYARLGRTYFPGIKYETFNSEQKQAIEGDIAQDLATAHAAISRLPKGARPAVALSYDYYTALFNKLKRADVTTLKTSRVRIPNSQKLLILARRSFMR